LDINLFTQVARSEFIKGMQSVPQEKLDVNSFVTWIPSSARIETQLWMTPSPGISEYVGRRRLAKLDQIKLLVENKEFDGAISVPTRDIEDDLVGGYPLRFVELGVKAARFPERWIYQRLANGANMPSIDGTNFFATAHNWGNSTLTLPSPFTGGWNNLTYTSAASSDGATAKSVFMVVNGADGPVRPMMYQRRKDPEIVTDAGTPQARIAKQATYAVDLEAEAFPGWWWQAILVNWVNTPNLQDIFTVIDGVIRLLLQYQLPAALPSDPPMFVHQGLDLTPGKEIGTVVCSPLLAQLFAHALYEDRVGISPAGSTAGITWNIYRNRWRLISTAYMV
jgi:phage major head subunit gpT-like protein